jgi:DNA repair photolyase
VGIGRNGYTEPTISLAPSTNGRMSDKPQQRYVGRGSAITPANRFVARHTVADFEQLAADDELLADDRALPTQFLTDQSQSLISENDSPDIPFRFSINPYRGCEHGCVYCYARPGHEYLGFDAGLDFETKVLVKHDAPRLLRRELCRRSWRGDTLAISGVTDCYQPAERRFRLTRGLIEVLLEARQAFGIVTKNALVLRDLDLLRPLAELNLVHVNFSITTLDAELARTMEPRTSTPAAKLRAIRALSEAGVPTRVMVSPVVPGLTDREAPAILRAAAEAGARSAGYILLRLPLAVRPIFQDWLARTRPDAAGRIEALIRDTRGGRMNDAQFGRRMRGQGEYAEQLLRTFQVFARRYGLDQPMPELDHSLFRPPRSPSGQGLLF